MTTEHTPRPGRTWDTTLTRTEVVVPDDAPDPQPNRATRRAADPPVTVRLVPTVRLVRVCPSCRDFDHPAQSCASAAAEHAVIQQLLDEATSRITRCWATGYGDPGPAFTNPAH